MLATEREVFDRLVFNSTLELKAAQIKKQDEDRRTPYGESFQASLQMPTEAELESFLAEGTSNDAEDEDEKKDEETTYRCLELPAAAKALLSATEHATSSSSTATEHATSSSRPDPAASTDEIFFFLGEKQVKIVSGLGTKIRTRLSHC